jgi:hypothetical protein
MKTADDTTYYGHRLTVELDRARESDKMEVKLVHLAMAAGYRAKLYSAEPDEALIMRPTLV